MRKLTSNERKLVLEYAKKLLEIKTSWDNRFENLGKILSFNYDNMNSSDQKLKDSIFFSYYRYYNDGDKLGFKKAELQKIGCSDATINSLSREATTNIRQQTKPFKISRNDRSYIYPKGYKPDIDRYESAMEDAIACTIKYFVKKYPAFFNKSGRQKTIQKWKEEIIGYTKSQPDSIDTYWVAEFAKQFNTPELDDYRNLYKSGTRSITDKSEISKILKIMLKSSFDSYERS